MSPYTDVSQTGYRWLYIDFNSYFASVEQQLHPELRGKPVAVVPVETDFTCAIAASYEAKAYGIKTGTPIFEAKRICPQLVCVLANHEYYVNFHQKILDEVEKHLPITAVCSIDEVACRLMDNETSPAQVVEIAEGIKRGLAANVGAYVKCSIGIGPNKYLAKIAADMQKPDGLTLLPVSKLPDALFQLKLADLPGIGRNLERRLLLSGISTVQELLALDAKRMRSIWKNLWGEKLYYLLRGYELPEEETRRSSVSHSHILAPELRDAAKAHFVMRRLVLKAASRLRRIGYYASQIAFSVRLEDGPRITWEAQCYRAQDSMTFLHLMEECWQQMMKQAQGRRLKKVSVWLHGLVAAEALEAAPELFPVLSAQELKARMKAEKISKALDKINHRFGRDSALVGMLPSQGKAFSGTKVAFNRIPDVEEFLE